MAKKINSMIPNTPIYFTGRNDELNRINVLLERGPLAILSGPEGIGKTALALAAANQTFAVDGNRAIFIGLRPGPPAEDVRLQIIRNLVNTFFEHDADWSTVGGEDELDGALIELAEVGQAHVLLDDLHHAGESAAESLLVLLARYARRSRWIVTSCARPRAFALAPQVVELAGLPDDAMYHIMDMAAPALSGAERANVVASAAGSPWLLQQVLANPGDDGTSGRVFESLPDEAIRFLKAILPIDRALPVDLLQGFTQQPIHDMLTTLERRGLIQSSYGLYRIHDVVRRLLTRYSAPLRSDGLAAGRPLATQGEPDVMLEGVRLLMLAGAVDDVLVMLKDLGEVLIETGHAPRMWQLLVLSEDPRLNVWRLRCAVAIGQPSLLNEVSTPRTQDPHIMILWCRSLLIRGKCEEALDLATTLTATMERSQDSGYSQVRVSAGLLVVECLSKLRRYDLARSVLSEVEAADQTSQTLVDSWNIYLKAVTGNIEKESFGISSLTSRALSLPTAGGVRAQALNNLAKVLGLIGRPSDAYNISKHIISRCIPNSKNVSTHFAIAMDLARFKDARDLLARLEPFYSDKMAFEKSICIHKIFYQFCTGDVELMSNSISYWAVELERTSNLYCLEALRRVETLYKMARADSPPYDSSDLLVRVRPTEDTRILWGRLYNIRWMCRWGRSNPDLLISEVDEYETGRVDTLLVENNPASALDLCDRIVSKLVSVGLLAVAMDMQQMRCDALLMMGRWDELRTFCLSLYQEAVAAGFLRIAGEAEFFQAFGPNGRVDWGLLDRLASTKHPGPIAMRRAQVILGDCAQLDMVDHRVLGALREQFEIRPAVSLSLRDGTVSERWILAEDEHRVWLPGDRSQSLSERHQLWALLVALFEGGGAAKKEDLVRQVWGEREYHPLRHDNRLHVAIRKLRNLIEDDPARPCRVVTTLVGYALAGDVRYATLRS